MLKSRGVSSAGRASALQAEGHRFDPDTLHQWSTELNKIKKSTFITTLFCLIFRQIDIVNRVIHETFLIITIKNCLSKFITLTKIQFFNHLWL